MPRTRRSQKKQLSSDEEYPTPTKRVRKTIKYADSDSSQSYIKPQTHPIKKSNPQIQTTICNQLEATGPFNTDCCVKCTNKELIRAANIQDIKLFTAILNSKLISHPFERWGPETDISAAHILFARNDKKFLTVFAKALSSKPVFAKPQPYSIRNAETGHNNKYAYGTETRKVSMGRQSEGNNAFVDDITIESFWSRLFFDEIATMEFDPSIIQVITAQGALKKFQVQRLHLSIKVAVRAGNYKLAGAIIAAIYKQPSYGFNQLHFEVLTLERSNQLGHYKKPSVTKKTAGGFILTPLHCAAINPNPQFLEALLNISHEISIIDELLRKPIHYAAACQSSGPLELLISKGVDINDGDRRKMTPLMIAAQYGRVLNIPFLVASETVNLKNRDGNAALHLAAKYGHVKCVKLLLPADADVNLPGEARQTATILASAHGHFDVVQLLLENGAKVNLKDKFKRNAVAMAARNGNLKILNLLLSAGGDFNQCDSSKNYPIHYAAAYGFVECIDALIAAGADMNVKNSWNLTPLSIGLQKNHTAVMRKLLSYKETDVNCKDDKGRTLVATQARLQDESIEQLKYLILNKHADVNLKDMSGRSPLHHAVTRLGNVQKVQFLIDHGSDVNAVDNNGQSAFLLAMQIGNCEAALAISGSKKFDIHKVNKNGQTLLHEIVECNAYMNEKGFEVLRKMAMHYSRDQLNQVDKQGLNAVQLLVINFCKFINTYYKVSLKKRIKDQLRQNDMECEVMENSNKDEDEEEEEEHDDEDDQEEPEDQDDRCSEDDEDELNQITQELLEDNDEDEEINNKQEIEKGKVIVKLNGQLYKINDPMISLPFKAYSSEKYCKYYNIKKNAKANKQRIKPTLELVKKCELETIKECEQIEQNIISLVQQLKCNIQIPNGMQLLHYIYAFYPKRTMCALFELDSVHDQQCSPLHSFAQYVQGSRLYSVDQFMPMSMNNSRDNNGNTVSSLLAIRNIQYKNVNNVNLQNQVPLIESIKSGNLPEELLEVADTNFCDLDGRNSLHHALMQGNLEILHMILEKGVDHTKQDKYDRTPLFYAFINDNALNDNSRHDPFEMVSYVAKECNIIDIYGRTPLHYAAVRGSSMSARQMLSKGAKIDVIDKFGNTALATAMLASHFDFCIMLIDNHANLNMMAHVIDFKLLKKEITKGGEPKKQINPDSDNENEDSEEEEEENDDDDVKSVIKVKPTPRYRNRYQYGKKEPIVEDPDPTNYQNLKIGAHSFFKVVVYSKELQVGYLLVSNGFPLIQSIEDCISCNNYDLLLNLLMKSDKQDLLKCNSNEQTILHLLASNQFKNADKLYKYVKHIDIHKLDIHNKNVLHYACSSGFKYFIDVCLNNNVDTNQLDSNGLSPFAYYVQSKHYKDIQLSQWVSAGCKIDIPTGTLTYLIQQHREQSVSLLSEYIAQGCDVNARDTRGRTALMASIMLNNLDLVKLILKQTTFNPIAHIDNDGKTPLHHVVQPQPFGSYENIQILILLKMFDINQADGSGRTPLDYAMGYDQSEIKDHLLKLKARKTTIGLPRRAPTSIVSEVDWPVEEIDYIADATEYFQHKEVIKKYQVDEVSKNEYDNVVVLKDYSALMTKVDVGDGYYSKHVFYKMQILYEQNREVYVLLTRWGRVCTTGQYQHTAFQTEAECVKEFTKIYKDKSGNEWGQEPKNVPKKYHIFKQKPYKNIQKYLKSFESPLPSHLPTEILKVIKQFTDITMYKQALQHYEVEEDSLENLARNDLETADQLLNELIVLSDKLLKLREAKELDLEEVKKVTSEIDMLSSRFYEFVPDVANSNQALEALDNKDTIIEKQKLVSTLLNFEITSKILLGALHKQNTISPYNYCFNALNIRMLLLPTEHPEHLMITAYAQDHIIKQVFCIERKGEAKALKKYQNRMLLWHGSKVSNYMGILASGLKIAPPWADSCGALFGKGIYFADAFKKSLNYTHDWDGNHSEFKYLLLCEVALGKQQEVTKLDKFVRNTKMQSVKGIGKQQPDMNQCITISNGCKVPIGDLIQGNNKKAELEMNEYVVYEEQQVRIRYLIQI